MLIAVVLSAFVNVTPVVVVFMPIVLALARCMIDRLKVLNSTTQPLAAVRVLLSELRLTCRFRTPKSQARRFGMFEVKLGIVFVIVTFIYML